MAITFAKGVAKETKTTYKNLTISAIVVESATNFPFETKGDFTHNKFKITVKDINNKKISFDWYGSTSDYEKRVLSLDENDLLNALSCFISDALAGNTDFEDFCNEMCYDTDSRKAYKIYKECVKSYNKFTKLDLQGQDIYDFINELQDSL